MTRDQFYQSTLRNGLGYQHATGMAVMRGFKAESGLTAVHTQQDEIHPSPDCKPLIEGRS